MNDQLISVIIPCHNNEETIARTIDSVVRQSYREIEILVVDDCSTDNTVRIVRQLASLDERIKLFIMDYNQGAGAARNRALEVATGRYVAFLDSDDLWNKNKLKLQVNFMKKNNSAICHTSYTVVDEADQDIPGKVVVNSVVNLGLFLKTTEIGMSTAVVDRRIVGDFRLELARTRQDAMLWINLLSRGFLAHGLNENLVKYRKRKGQISGNKLVMLYRTFCVYIRISKLPIYRRVYYYGCYVLNAVRKRL